MDYKKFILEFIKLYRSLPALWDVKSKLYTDRILKNENYETLLEKYQEMYPNGTKSDLKRKINSLRTCYRRELKRISTLEESGDSLSKENESALFYFDALSFLPCIEQTCPPRISLLYALEQQNGSETEDSSPPLKKSKISPLEENTSETEFPFSTDKCNFVDIPLPTASDTGPFNQSNSNKYERSSQQSDREHQTEYNNEADIFARAWGIQFQYLSEHQKIFAKKAIDDILFEARLGTLHRQSIKINDSLCQHCQTNLVNDMEKNYQEDHLS